MNSFMKSQVSYCPLVWIFHDRGAGVKIKKIHVRELRIFYKNNHSNFEALLELDNAASIHQRNLQFLIVEM